MNTTTIFIELLITGLQTTIWIILLVLCLCGFDWINLERIKGFEAIIAVILLPIVYPIGVLFDLVTNSLFGPWERSIQRLFIVDKTQSSLTLLMRAKDPSLASYLGYGKSRIRISRSSVINFALITLTSMAFTITWCRNISGFPIWRAVILEATIGATLTILAVFAWYRITRSYFKLIVKGFNPDADIIDDGIIEREVLDTSLPVSQTKTDEEKDTAA